MVGCVIGSQSLSSPDSSGASLPVRLRFLSHVLASLFLCSPPPPHLSLLRSVSCHVAGPGSRCPSGLGLGLWVFLGLLTGLWRGSSYLIIISIGVQTGPVQNSRYSSGVPEENCVPLNLPRWFCTVMEGVQRSSVVNGSDWRCPGRSAWQNVKKFLIRQNFTLLASNCLFARFVLRNCIQMFLRVSVNERISKTTLIP